MPVFTHILSQRRRKKTGSLQVKNRKIEKGYVSTTTNVHIHIHTHTLYLHEKVTFYLKQSNKNNKGKKH